MGLRENDQTALLHKAFNKVQVWAIQKIGSNGDFVEWVQHWLGYKRQRAVEWSYSEWRSVTRNVLQGSMVGLLLFVIHVNDLDKNGGLVNFQLTQKNAGIVVSENVVTTVLWSDGNMNGQMAVWVSDGQVWAVTLEVKCKRKVYCKWQDALGALMYRGILASWKTSRLGGKEAFVILPFVSWGVECKSWHVMLQLYTF